MRDGDAFFRDLADVVPTEAASRARNVYSPNATLIINCKPTTVFTMPDWNLLTEHVTPRFVRHSVQRVLICS